mmetsp:Transcript_8909/g.8812  ORF Transcript_8909/g.8812 Transcript_8909/m.8812 type:complete len:211 (+) Transcript_8909:816-1448(+)
MTTNQLQVAYLARMEHNHHLEDYLVPRKMKIVHLLHLSQQPDLYLVPANQNQLLVDYLEQKKTTTVQLTILMLVDFLVANLRVVFRLEQKKMVKVRKVLHPLELFLALKKMTSHQQDSPLVLRKMEKRKMKSLPQDSRLVLRMMTIKKMIRLPAALASVHKRMMKRRMTSLQQDFRLVLKKMTKRKMTSLHQVFRLVLRRMKPKRTINHL